MTFTSTHKEALAKAHDALFCQDGGVNLFDNLVLVQVIRTYVEARGAKIVPASSSTEWAEKYCALTNREPGGIQATSTHDGWVETTFREMAGREISAMLSASPDPFTDEVAHDQTSA